MSWGKRRGAGWDAEVEGAPQSFSFTGVIKTILEVVPGGVIRAGKTAYADDVNTGFWLGVDADGIAKFNIGGVVAGVLCYLKWTGSALAIAGDIVAASITGTLKLIDASTSFGSEADPGTATGWVGLYDAVGRRGKWLGYDGGVLQAYLDSNGAIKWAAGKGTLDNRGWEYRESAQSVCLVSSVETQSMLDVATERAFGAHIAVSADGAWAVWGDCQAVDGVGVRGDAFSSGGVGVYGFAQGAEGVGVVAGAYGDAEVALRVYGGIVDGGSQRFTRVGDATADTDALNRRTGDARYVVAGSVPALPAGMMSAFGGSSAPAGWLLCHGAVVSRATYAALFAAVGVTYGAGDGSTTFGLPDMRQKFPRGKGAADTLGAAGGAATHTHAAHAALSHSGAAVAAHAALTHSGAGVSAHSGAAVGDHAAHTHGYGTLAVADHTRVATKQGAAAGDVVTTNTHTVSGSTGNSSATLTHSVTQPGAHTVTQPSDHAAQNHSMTQPDQHAAAGHDSPSSEPPYINLNWIIKI